MNIAAWLYFTFLGSLLLLAVIEKGLRSYDELENQIAADRARAWRARDRCPECGGRINSHVSPVVDIGPQRAAPKSLRAVIAEVQQADKVLHRKLPGMPVDWLMREAYEQAGDHCELGTGQEITVH